MNPDDTNQNPPAGDNPAAAGADSNVPPVADTTTQPPSMGSTPPPADQNTGAPSEPTPASDPAAGQNCHCGKPSVSGNCSGCNLPEGSCTCTPAA